MTLPAMQWIDPKQRESRGDRLGGCDAVTARREDVDLRHTQEAARTGRATGLGVEGEQEAGDASCAA